MQFHSQNMACENPGRNTPSGISLAHVPMIVKQGTRFSFLFLERNHESLPSADCSLRSISGFHLAF